MSDRPPLVLIVEDDASLRRYLVTTLQSFGYRTEEAITGRACVEAVLAGNPDVILLDLGLPDRDGLEVAKELREWCKTPIIVVSARGQDEDKIHALDLGADDYLTKPFSSGELLARIRVALRHATEASHTGVVPVVETGPLKVDFASRQVLVDGIPVHLSPTEYDLLSTLARHAGKVLTQSQLLKEIWKDSSAAQPVYLRVYMASLRKKIERDPAKPVLLITEPGVGYRLKG